VPHDSTLSRRRKNLAVEIPYRARSGPPHLVIDSTGLKGLGEGEEARGRRAARLAQGPRAERIGVISGDGTYDTRGVHEASADRRTDLVVPPRRNGTPWKRRTTGATGRNETLRAIRHPRRRWSGDHQRSHHTFNALGRPDTVART